MYFFLINSKKFDSYDGNLEVMESYQFGFHGHLFSMCVQFFLYLIVTRLILIIDWHVPNGYFYFILVSAGISEQTSK